MLKRLLQVCLVLFAATVMLGAGNPGTRFDKLGHQLMCTCGCAEILLECNHMGCPDSPNLIAKLHEQLATGASDSSILHWFAGEFGATVLASPIRGGFDIVAWIMPFAVLALGIIAIVWLLRHWKERHHVAALGPSGIPAGWPQDPADHLRDRIRQETTYES